MHAGPAGFVRHVPCNLSSCQKIFSEDRACVLNTCRPCHGACSGTRGCSAIETRSNDVSYAVDGVLISSGIAIVCALGPLKSTDSVCLPCFGIPRLAHLTAYLLGAEVCCSLKCSRARLLSHLHATTSVSLRDLIPRYLSARSHLTIKAQWDRSTHIGCSTPSP